MLRIQKRLLIPCLSLILTSCLNNAIPINLSEKPSAPTVNLCTSGIEPFKSLTWTQKFIDILPVDLEQKMAHVNCELVKCGVKISHPELCEGSHH